MFNIILSLVGIFGLIYFMIKGLGEVTNIDEDEMTKTFETMKKFDR